MFDNDSSIPGDYTATRYDLSLSNTTLSLSINITSILSWLNDELADYINNDKIPSIHDLVGDWQDGRAFLCLTHRFYSIDNFDATTFDSLIGEGDSETTTTAAEMRRTLAFSVFERELGLAPPSSTDPETPIPMYIAKVRHALQSLTPTSSSIDSDSNDPWKQRTQAVLDTIQNTRQQLQLLGYHPSPSGDDTLKRHDYPSLEPDTASNHAADDANDAHQRHSDMHHQENDDNNTLDGRSRSTSGWEEDLGMMEQLLLDLHRLLDEYHSWADDNMDDDLDSDSDVATIQTKINKRKALVQSVKNAHNSFQGYLEHDQQVLGVFRKRALFTQATAPIRQDLDWVQAEMLKTTTTDSGIKELEDRVHHAGILLHQLVQQYNEDDHQINNDILFLTSDMDQPQQLRQPYANRTIVAATDPTAFQDSGDQQQQKSLFRAEVDALVKKYRLVHSWVADVRIWFVEAQRIRKWIGERIDILERAPVPDGVSSQQLSITADEVEDLNANIETLEKELELFDKEDMSRLRKHVKDLTVATAKEKDLSPADTTTIEITFTTLMTLDQLKHLLNRHSYDVQILTLRVFWENEYAKTTDWVGIKADELGDFIKSQARWQDHSDTGNNNSVVESTHSKAAVIDKLLEFEVEISTFDQGQFTTTVNLYQEMDDTSKVELPGFLESRQVNIEEKFEALVHRASFARRVVEQYLTMMDFMESSHRLLYTCMDGLCEKLVQQTDGVYALFLKQQKLNEGSSNTTDDGKNNIYSITLDIEPLMDEHINIQEQAVRLITETAALIPNTETTYTLDQQENNTGNDRVQLAVKSRSSELMSFGESLEQKLKQHRQALQWHTQLNTVYTDLQQLQNQIDLDTHAASRMIEDFTITFGDQTLRISDALIHDKGDNWDQHLQNYKQKLGIHQINYEKVDGDIKQLLDIYTGSSETMPTTVLSSIKYLENGGQLVGIGLQTMVAVMGQWESGLCMMKDRQAWERQHHAVIQLVTIHEQKCQHIQMEATWSPDDTSITQENAIGHRWDIVSALEQEWDEFKGRSLSPLIDTFDRLVGGAETKWAAQRQRQDSLMVRVDEVDDILSLTKALLEQRKAITQFLSGAQDIRSRGTRWLNALEVSVLQHHMEEISVAIESNSFTLDIYNANVTDLWTQWQLFDNDLCARVTGKKHGNWGMLTDLNRHCDSVKGHASDQYHILLSLAESLEQWEVATKENEDIRYGIKVWGDKVYLLNGQVMDIVDTLMVKKDALLTRLTLDYATENDTSGILDSDSWMEGTDQQLETLDRLVQQWQNHEFGLLDADGLDLERRTKMLMEKLTNLGYDRDGKEPLDIITDVNNARSLLTRLQSQCETMAQPLLSMTHQLVKTSGQHNTWNLEWMKVSSYSDKLQVRLQNAVLDKENWVRNITTGYSMDTLQHLAERVEGIALDIDTNDGQQLLNSENTSYATMKQLYHDLSVHELPDILHFPVMTLPTELQARHTEIQQSIPHIQLTLKQLDADIKWLGMGASWLKKVDGQLENWHALMSELVDFTNRDAKWTVGSNEKRKPHAGIEDDIGAGGLLDLDAILTDLCRRVDSLTNNLEATLDELHHWKFPQPDQECDVHDMGDLDGFKLWYQKALELENYCSVAKSYLSYASNVVDHRKMLQKWSEKMVGLELQGNNAKAAILAENGNLGATELVRLVTDFDDNLTGLIDGTQNVNYPVPPDLTNRHLGLTTTTTTTTNADDDYDADVILHQYILSRHELLKETSTSLHCILDAKELSARLKALVDGHVTKASESLQWIKATNEKLQHVFSGDISEWELGLLESKLEIVYDLEKSKNLHAGAYYHRLKDSADYCMETVHSGTNNNGQDEHGGGDGDEDDNSSVLRLELERITSIQQQVEMDWNKLSDSLQQHGDDLKNALKRSERTYWSNQIMDKCKAVDDQLSIISDLNLDTVQDEQLDQWQHTINEIKSVDLNHLCDLFGSESMENLDDGSRLTLVSATDAHLQLENRIQQIYLNVQHTRQKSKYNNLSLSLISFIDNTEIKLVGLQDEFGKLSATSGAAVDEAYYGQVKMLRDSVLGDWTGHEQIYKQEGELFLSTKFAVDGLDEIRAIDQQHQQVMSGWTDLQQEMEKVDKYYHVMTQRRPILDILHHASSILDNIDDGNDDDDAKQQIDRIERLITETSKSMKQQQQNESSIMTSDNEKKMCVNMDDIYQQRCDILLDRMRTVEQRMQKRQKQQHIQQMQQRYQEISDKIVALAEKELSTLELPQPQDDDSIEPNSGTAFYNQQYQQWAKQLGSSEQTLQNLTQEAESFADTMKSLSYLGQTDMDGLATIHQEPLDNLGNHIQRQQRLLALVRRILTFGKSADNIISWLGHFQKAVDGNYVDDVPTASNGNSDPTVEEDVNELEVKLQGFEPIMESLGSMNKTIQDYDSLDDREYYVASQWKKLAQNRFDEVNTLWNESVNAMETGKKMAIKTQNATALARKIKSLISMMGDSRDQIEQLQDLSSTNDTISADSDLHNQQNRPSLFKLIPRKRDLSSAYDKLEAIENNLMADGQARRLEIGQLIEQHCNDQKDNARPFLQQQDEMDAAWTSIMDVIDKTKRSLSDEKAIGKYLGMVDDIDVLLGSMDEVVFKASPHYHATAIDNKFSKVELQAKLIELNARYDYYKLNIQQDLQRADDYWVSTITGSIDTNQNFDRLKAIIIQHHTAQKARWSKLSVQQVPSRQFELKKAMASSLSEAEKTTRLRKSSLPTRKAAAALSSTHPQALHSTTSSRLRPPKTISIGLHPSSALNGQQQLRKVSSSSSLTRQDKKQHHPRQSTSTSTSTSSISIKSTKSASSLSTKTTRSASSTFLGTKKKAVATTLARKPPNAYVAQAGNALDVEIGRIVNETPYQVKVKMVPGEVGRYWFGDANPKLVYCRVLKSKMVMVRVGGGWAELSQFLRDHAKLEGSLIIPKQEDQHLLHTTMQEGYLETTSTLQRQRKQRMQGQMDHSAQQKTTTSGTTLAVPTPLASISSSSSSSIPTHNMSRSTSSNKSSTIQQNGYKDGDKFIAVDRHGKQLEVKMTRFSQRSALPTSTTNRRRKGVKQ